MTICIPLPADTGSIPFTQIHALRFAAGRLPEGVSRVRAYINKNNRNSQTIAGKLGMKAVGENKSGSSWLYEGPIEKLAAFAGGAHRKNP